MKQFNCSGCVNISILVQIKITLFKCIPCLSSLSVLWFTLQCGLRAHKLDPFQWQLQGKMYFRITSIAFPASLGIDAQDQGRALKCIRCACQVLSTNWFALQIFPYGSTLLANVCIVSSLVNGERWEQRPLEGDPWLPKPRHHNQSGKISPGRFSEPPPSLFR